MQLDDWPLVEVALLLVGQTHISFDKISFDPLGRDKSSFRLPAQFPDTGGYIGIFLHFYASKVKLKTRRNGE